MRALGRAADSLPAGETLVLAGVDAMLRRVFSIAGLLDRPSLELGDEA